MNLLTFQTMHCNVDHGISPGPLSLQMQCIVDHFISPPLPSFSLSALRFLVSWWIRACALWRDQKALAFLLVQKPGPTRSEFS